MDKLKTFSFKEIIDYLQRTHEFFIRKRLPEIEQSISNLKIYVEYRQLFLHLEEYLIKYQKKLKDHIVYEERYLFPYILSFDTPLAYQKSSVLQDFVADHDDEVERSIEHVRSFIQKFSKMVEDNSPDQGS